MRVELCGVKPNFSCCILNLPMKKSVFFFVIYSKEKNQRKHMKSNSKSSPHSLISVCTCSTIVLSG